MTAQPEFYNPVEYACSLKLPSPAASLIMMLLEATAHGIVRYHSVAEIIDRVGCNKLSFRRALKLISKLGAATFDTEGGQIVARFNGMEVRLDPLPSEARDDPWQIMRARVFATKGCECTYCGSPASHVDHVLPRAKGGTDTIDNLVPACARCNNAKGTKTLEEWRGAQ